MSSSRSPNEQTKISTVTTTTNTNYQDLSADVIAQYGRSIDDVVADMTNVTHAAIDGSGEAMRLMNDVADTGLNLAGDVVAENNDFAVELIEASMNNNRTVAEEFGEQTARAIEFANISTNAMTESFAEGLKVIGNNTLGIASDPDMDKKIKLAGIIAGTALAGTMLIVTRKKK